MFAQGTARLFPVRAPAIADDPGQAEAQKGESARLRDRRHSDAAGGIHRIEAGIAEVEVPGQGQRRGARGDPGKIQGRQGEASRERFREDIPGKKSAAEGDDGRIDRRFEGEAPQVIEEGIEGVGRIEQGGAEGIEADKGRIESESQIETEEGLGAGQDEIDVDRGGVSQKNRLVRRVETDAVGPGLAGEDQRGAQAEDANVFMPILLSIRVVSGSVPACRSGSGRRAGRPSGRDSGRRPPSPVAGCGFGPAGEPGRPGPPCCRR